jgi:hypothetical protein
MILLGTALGVALVSIGVTRLVVNRAAAARAASAPTPFEFAIREAQSLELRPTPSTRLERPDDAGHVAGDADVITLQPAGTAASTTNGQPSKHAPPARRLTPSG